MKLAGWWLLLCLNPIAHGATLSLAAPVEYISLLRPFYEEWLGSAKVDFLLVPCTRARCQKLLDHRTVDGDIARLKGFEQSHPHMIPVGEPIGHVIIYAKSQIKAKWPPTRQQLVGCLRGTLWCKNHQPGQAIVWFNNDEQGLAMLKRGRFDWLIKVRPAYQSPLTEPWQPIANIEVYLFLNKQHQSLVTALLNTQQQLIASGR